MPVRGLSGYYLTDGDTLYLRFTLAYGKGHRRIQLHRRQLRSAAQLLR